MFQNFHGHEKNVFFRDIALFFLRRIVIESNKLRKKNFIGFEVFISKVSCISDRVQATIFVKCVR